MARLGRKGRVLKWAGSILSLLIGTAWASSLPYSVKYSRTTARSLHVAVYLYHGTVLCFAERRASHPQAGRWLFGNSSSLQPQWWRGGSSTTTFLRVPLWMPFSVIALPTVVLWWLDRRRRSLPGHCQNCGYNLTGNVSGICPECGEKV
jgi:hypothetical protein